MYGLRVASFFLFLVFLFGFSIGCASSDAGLALSNIPIDSAHYKVLGYAEKTAYWFTIDLGILRIPLGHPPFDRLEKSLMKQKGGNALIGISYYTDRFYVFGFFVNSLHIRAKVILTSSKNTESLENSIKRK